MECTQLRSDLFNIELLRNTILNGLIKDEHSFHEISYVEWVKIIAAISFTNETKRDLLNDDILSDEHTNYIANENLPEIFKEHFTSSTSSKIVELICDYYSKYTLYYLLENELFILAWKQ